MRNILRNLLLGIAVSTLAVPSAPAVDQKDIDRAIELGVKALKELQGADGTWQYEQIGATALAGITLLECDVPPTDRSVLKAAEAVRKASVDLTQTYSISLAIVFLDRLGNQADIPLIESLAVRLLAGQEAAGGWGYNCPPINDNETRRLTAVINRRGDGEKPPETPPKRTAKDLTPEITQQLAMLNRVQFEPAGLKGGDNSNTQFAALGLWVARRHGMPVDDALDRLAFRFRRTQASDGGWAYFLVPVSNVGPPPGYERMMQQAPQAKGLATPTAAMTCSGLMCLAVSHGASLDPDRDPRRQHIDPEKDVPLQRGLLALSSAIGNPFGKDGKLGDGIPVIDEKNGEAYYFFWSLERVAVALGMETIGKKDWYAWGAEILLANQHVSGRWHGNYASCGADTCFALLFLRRANLTRDLSARMQRRVRDEVVLRVGGVGGSALKGGPKVKSALDPKDADARATGPGKIDPKVPPIPTASENRSVDKLSDELVRATGAERGPTLQKLRESKGVEYTEALALAIPRLDADTQSKAREALAERLTRMTAAVLARYHSDTDPEIRRAAVLASSMKDVREHIPALIDRLSDSDPAVSRAAVTALKAMTNQDFGPAQDASREDHEKAVQAWKDWWKRQAMR